MDSEVTVSFEQGKIAPLDFFAKIKEILHLKLSYQAFVPIWNEVFFLNSKNRSVFSLISNLRERYRIALISNTNILHHEYLKKHFPLFSIFNQIFLSYELGLVKPDPLIYQKTLESLDVRPQEVFYVDDRPELVKSGRELGMQAFVFNGARQLQADFLSLGIISH